jgi:hypothetical protein
VRITQSKQADITWSFVVDPTAAPTAAPTTTAPTTTAPTSNPSTSTATTTPPAPGAPQVQVGGTTCSFGARASGSATVSVTNPADGAGATTYTVAVGARAAQGFAADDTTTSVRLIDLPAGQDAGSVTGTDGTAAAFAVSVPTCPRYLGTRVYLHRLAHHRWRIVLDNTRNAAATRFTLEVAKSRTGRVVAAAATSRVGLRLYRTRTVAVFVGTHLIRRARLG